MRLLLACVRRPGGEPDHEVIRGAVALGPDWNLVLERAVWHGVSTMLATTLTRTAADLLPPSLLAGLQRRSQATAVRNLFLFSRLASLFARFEEKGIPALVFKGSLLAHTVYEDPSLREFSDLDIVVREEDVARAGGLLEDLGFVARPGGDGRGRPRLAERAQYARTYDRGSDGVTVDLHWHLARGIFRAGIRVRRLWEETRTYEIGGMPIRSFTPEATLLVLCIHGSKHGPTPWSRLKWVVDVDRVVRSRPDFDWEAAGRLADEFGCRRILLIGVSLAAGLLGTPVPVRILERARGDRAVRAVVERSYDSLLHHPGRADTAPRDIVYRLAIRERWRDKLSTVLRGALLPQPEDWSRIRLPAALDFLYVPIRLVRLAGKAVLRGQIGSPAAVGEVWPTAAETGGIRHPEPASREWLEGPLRRVDRLLLAGRLWCDWAAVRWYLHRVPLPRLIARLDRLGRVRTRFEPRRLGRIVYRVLNLGPFRPRCLTMSLVLFRELRRQGTPAEIVIGLPDQPKDHAAHAWVEVERRVVGPPPGRLGHVEMARYGGPAPGAPTGETG